MGERAMEVKIKQERKDDEPQQVQQSSSSSRRPGEDRIRKREDPVSLVSSSRGLMDHQRVMGLVPPSPAKDPALWGPLTPSPTVSSMDHYSRLQGREADMRRFDHLMSQRDSAAAAAVMDLERMAAYDRAKLLPPPLRTNESPYATPPTLPPPVSASSFFSPPVSPYLGQLCATSGRSKAPPPGMLNGLPPPLIPCTFPVQNHSGFPRTSSPMAHKLIPGLQDNPYFTAAKERREVNGSGLPSDYDAHLRL